MFAGKMDHQLKQAVSQPYSIRQFNMFKLMYYHGHVESLTDEVLWRLNFKQILSPNLLMQQTKIFYRANLLQDTTIEFIAIGPKFANRAKR